MKKYINESHVMVRIDFTDGTGQFLFRGHSIVSDKDLVKLPKGVVVTDVIENKKKSKK